MRSDLQPVYDGFDGLERRVQDELLGELLAGTQALLSLLPEDAALNSLSVAIVAAIAQRGHGSSLPPVQPSRP